MIVENITLLFTMWLCKVVNVNFLFVNIGIITKHNSWVLNGMYQSLIQEALSTTFVINSILHFFLRLEVVWIGLDEIWLENNLLYLSNSDMRDFEQWLDLRIFWIVFSVHCLFILLVIKLLYMYMYIYAYIYTLSTYIMYMSINT